MIFKKLGTGISWTKGRPVLNIYARDENNKKVTIPVEGLPIYFYARETEKIEEEDMKKIVKITSGYRSIYGDDLKKVFVHKISEMRKLSRVYHGFEGDINWDKKMCLDLKITDMFWYEDGKVMTLDKRFVGPIVNEIVNQSVNSTIVINARQTGKNTAARVLQAEQTNFKFRVCCIDIEVIVENKDKLNTYEGEIVCAVLYDSYKGKYYCLKQNDVGGERQLLRDIWQCIKEHDFDILTGWNVEFDIRWIIKRAEFYGIDLSEYNREGDIKIFSYTNKAGKFVENIQIPGRSVVDGKELYIKQTKTTEKRASYSLKSIAVAEGFPEWEDLGQSVKRNWEADQDKVVEYCRLDVERTYQIIDKKSLIHNAEILCAISGANLDESMWNSKVIDSMLFLYKGNRVLPNITYLKKDEKDIEGGKVMKSIKGMHKNVAVLDAGSLYPSIIVGFNISGETLVKPTDLRDHYTINVNVNGEDRTFAYLKSGIYQGLLPEIVLELRKLREKIRTDRRTATEEKDEVRVKQLTDEEKVLKALLASVYGVTGFDSFRLYNEDVANTITGIARGVVLETIDKLQSERFNIIYGDTDSVFIQVKDHLEGEVAKDKVNHIMLEYVKGFGANETIIDMNYEKFFRWIMFSQEPSKKLKTKIYRKKTKSTKKKYIGYISYIEGKDGLMVPTNELYYKGFELRRSDSSKALKRVMKTFFLLMEDGDYQKSIDYLRDIKKEFHTYRLNDIAMPRAVNKEDAAGPYPRGMKYAKEVLKFDFIDDELPKLVYVKPQYKMPRTAEICYQDHHRIPNCFEIDYDKMFDRLITKKFEPILEALGVYWDVAVNDQMSLEKFC